MLSKISVLGVNGQSRTKGGVPEELSVQGWLGRGSGCRAHKGRPMIERLAVALEKPR